VRLFSSSAKGMLPSWVFLLFPNFLPFSFDFIGSGCKFILADVAEVKKSFKLMFIDGQM